MKKILSISLCILMIVGLTACGGGNTSYEPKESAKYGEVYRSTTNNEPDGSYPVINISNIEKKDGNIVISIGAPTIEQISYAYNNFLYVRPLDEKGNELKLDKINLEEIGKEDVVAKLNITGVDIEKLKWIEVGPYKTTDNNPAIFKVE